MPTFRFEGHDRFAKPLKGVVDAANEADACEQLRAKNIYAMKVEADSTEPMKTVLRGHEEMKPETPPRQATSAILTGAAAGAAAGAAPDPGWAKATPPPDSLELELFGGNQEAPAPAQTPPVQQPVPPAAVPGPALAQPPAGWELRLRARFEALSTVLRKVQEWKKAPEKGPAVGGKTWELFDQHLGAIAQQMMADAVRSAIEEQISENAGRTVGSMVITGGGIWPPPPTVTAP